MNKAIEQANEALLIKEVPIGAVLVDNKTKKIISFAHNLVNQSNSAIAHAEMLLIKLAAKKLCKKYLDGTSIFITLEPCAMCSAAISQMRIERIYFGAYDEKNGSLESIMKIYNNNHQYKPQIYGGINEIECSNLLKKFFIDKRIK
jgi:tRNA(adenine34) deaminase